MGRLIDVTTKSIVKSKLFECESHVLNGIHAKEANKNGLNDFVYIINLHLNRSHVRLEAGNYNHKGTM